MLRSALAILLLAPAFCWADSSYQDFWFGGPGTPGPVSYWGNAFDSCSGVDFGFPHSFQLLISYIHHHVSGGGCNAIETVDVNLDGDIDVVCCKSPYHCVVLYENLDGVGLSWEETMIADSLQHATSIDAVDMDSDGDSDFAVATEDGPVLLRNGNPGWSTVRAGTLHSDIICAGDIDGDGDYDFVSYYGPGHIGRWCENLDGTGHDWIEHTIWPNGHEASHLALADLNGDGDLDILISQHTSSNVIYFENTDGVGGNWELRVVCETVGGGATQAICAADLDQDGDLDVIAVASDPVYLTGVVAWSENVDGFGLSWQKHPIDASQTSAMCVGTFDMDLDGDPDALVGAGGVYPGAQDRVILYENVSIDAMGWEKHVVDSSLAGCSDIEGVDLDSDGSPDIAACGSSPIHWFDFTRAASAWLESSILDPPGGSQQSWTDLSWDATVPPGTNLTFQVRASNDPAGMGEWSPEISTPGSISAYLPNPCWYFQYRVNMATTSPPSSPMLDEILVQWNPVGIEGGPEAGEPALTILSGNPSPGIVTLDVFLPDAGAADLGIYDLTGRLVSKPVVGEIEAGHHGLTVSDLPSGLYCILLETPTESICSMLVVLRQGSP
jgi:hypothetical protein